MKSEMHDEAVTHWDASHLGCGGLVMQLRKRLLQLKPGQRIAVCADNAGARSDLPAWCRVTGHRLVSSTHPVYVIERKRT